VVWVVANQHSDVGHCFFRFIAGAEDRVHQFPTVDSGCFAHCVLFIHLSLLNIRWIKDDKFSSICVI